MESWELILVKTGLTRFSGFTDDAISYASAESVGGILCLPIIQLQMTNDKNRWFISEATKQFFTPYSVKPIVNPENLVNPV